MNNMELYNSFRSVPQEAQKTIGAGRLKGFTDINPMWRIKVLTERFGACGFGWYYTVDSYWRDATPTDELVSNVIISLYVKVDGEWSKPIQGIGGNKLVSNEKSGAYVSDEGYKMALTDALSVACKALGIGADVYYKADRTKYDAAPAPVKEPEYKCAECGKVFTECRSSSGKTFSAKDVYYNLLAKSTDGVCRCTECAKAKGTLI